MLLFLLCFVGNSLYPIYYIDQQPYIQLDSTLQAQIRLDELLSQFLLRYSTNAECNSSSQCYENYYDQNGQEQQYQLNMEDFTLYDIQNKQYNQQTVIYSDKALNQQDHLSKYNYLALGPYQQHKNTFYDDGFSLCLSNNDGFITPQYNQEIHEEKEMSVTGIFNDLKQTQYISYQLRINNLAINDQVIDISEYSVSLIQDDLIGLPQEIIDQILNLLDGFQYDVNSGGYIRLHDNKRNTDPKFSFYNSLNRYFPLIVESKDYIKYNYQNSIYDVLLITDSSEFGSQILLGLPFLKNKLISVQTQDNYIFIKQLEQTTCMEIQSSSFGTGTIIFIVLQIIFLPILIYFTFKKLRQYNEKRRNNYQYSINTELQTSQ